MPTTLRRFRCLVSLAAVPFLAAARGPCSPELPIGADETDAGAAAEPDAAAPDEGEDGDDAGEGADDAGEQPPALDLAGAARVCAMASSCLHGQMYQQSCIVALAFDLDADQYRSWTQGRAATVLEGESAAGGTSPTFGFPPRGNPVAIASILAEPGVRGCVEAAATCDDVYRCMNGDADSAECAPAAGTTRCDGSVLQACLYTDWTEEGFPPDIVGSAPRSFAFDCRAQGDSCNRGTALGTAWYGCSPGTCAAASCDGDVAVNCWIGHADRTQCAPETTCSVIPMGETGQAVCVADGPACDAAESPARCDGNTLVSCQNGVEVTADCAEPFACVTLESGEASCGLGDECSIADATRCRDGAVETCVLGQWVATSCADLGFAACTERFPAEPFCS